MQIAVRSVEFNLTVDYDQLRYLAGLALEAAGDPVLQQNLASIGAPLAGVSVLKSLCDAQVIVWNPEQTRLIINPSFGLRIQSAPTTH